MDSFERSCRWFCEPWIRRIEGLVWLLRDWCEVARSEIDFCRRSLFHRTIGVDFPGTRQNVGRRKCESKSMNRQQPTALCPLGRIRSHIGRNDSVLSELPWPIQCDPASIQAKPLLNICDETEPWVVGTSGKPRELQSFSKRNCPSYGDLHSKWPLGSPEAKPWPLPKLPDIPDRHNRYTVHNAYGKHNECDGA